MRRLLALTCLALCAVAISACATTTSTAKFKGAEKEVAQRVADLQSDVTAGEQKKICANDLASGVVSRLGGTKGCEAALKTQLAEVDSAEATVESVQINGSEASAKVRSTYSGRKKETALALRKEGSTWKISSLQ